MERNILGGGRNIYTDIIFGMIVVIIFLCAVICVFTGFFNLGNFIIFLLMFWWLWLSFFVMIGPYIGHLI